MENQHRTTGKVAVIIGIQIAIIFVSFFVLQTLESQKQFAGNSVNISGKNRFFTADVLNELLLYRSSGGTLGNPTEKLDEYRENLDLLKNGGIINDLNVKPLSEKFTADFDVLMISFSSYENSILQCISDIQSQNLDVTKLQELQDKADDLIIQTDYFTINLASDLETLSNELIFIQIVLGAINIAAHIVLIIFLVRLFRKESAHLVRMEKMFNIGQMAARLAHDLRNPLTVLKNNIDLLSEESTPDQKTKDRYDMMNRAIERMNHQVTDVMDFVRVRKLMLGEYSLSNILNNAIRTTEVPQNIKLVPPEGDIKLRCDARQIEVVFSNMISNAIQAIGISDGIIKIAFDQDLDNATITFEDTGPGIPADVMPKIFDPLFTTKEIGTGLGLVSCKNIIEQHKGKISVKNNPTRFVITIPKTITE